MATSNMYCEYFDVNETYFPCIDESAINTGEVDWNSTYPHETFIGLLGSVDKMLGGGNKTFYLDPWRLWYGKISVRLCFEENFRSSRRGCQSLLG